MADTMHMTPEEVKKHVKVYVMVFGALAVLTIVTVAVSYLDLNILPALILALIIALVKGGLVASYFLVCMFLLFISAQGDHAAIALLVKDIGTIHVA